ncbi:MAG: cation:proton antiporter [Actinobacteria bacterium]|nr:cation:proton antiporter [Actinomycetota bacterium]
MDVLQLPLTHPAFVFIVVFGVMLVAPIAAERLGVPGLIGLIVAGTFVGPHTTGLLEREGVIEVLGDAGLLYLMFLVGLDLDRESFAEHRRPSLVFAAATFVIPMLLVTGAGVGLGLSLVGALIVASAFTSHTPITYPLVQRLGLARNPAVIATIGATLISTVGALLVFAIVAAIGDDVAPPVFWIQLVAILVVFLFLVLRGLPRLTKWFFAGLGQDRIARFVFVLVVLFGSAALAEITGIQAIVGAFLAGFGVAKFVPAGSWLRDRVEFLGQSFLVPVFLVSTGMIIDPIAVVTAPERIALGLGLTVAAFGAKTAAAGVTARVLGYSRPELGMMISLTGAQAAGALAVTLVAVEVGLLQERALDAVILVILLTCIGSVLIGERSAPRMQRPARKIPPLGRTVVVPIANPHSVGPLAELAGLIAVGDGGEVLAVNVLGFEASREQLDEHRTATEAAEKLARSRGADARSLVRIDSSPSEGVLHTVVENDASCVLLGWKGYANARENFFGGIIDTVLRQVRVTALVCRPGTDEAVERIVLAVTRADLTPAGRLDLDLSIEVATRLADEGGVPLLVIMPVNDKGVRERLGEQRETNRVLDPRRPTESLPQRTLEGDIVVLGTPPTRPGIGHNSERIARSVPDRTVIVAVRR